MNTQTSLIIYLYCIFQDLNAFGKITTVLFILVDVYISLVQCTVIHTADQELIQLVDHHTQIGNFFNIDQPGLIVHVLIGVEGVLHHFDLLMTLLLSSHTLASTLLNVKV